MEQEKMPLDFSGTKIALINSGKVLAILRDDKPDIPFPNMWDLPGGAREEGEVPMEVAIRETKEELGIELKPKELLWQNIFPAVADPNKKALFMVFAVTNQQLNAIKFGDEGREWKMVSFEEFMSDDKTVPGMQTRLHDYLVIAHLLR